MLIGIVGVVLIWIIYWSTERILNRIEKRQDILLARLRLMESTLFSLGLDKVDKRIEECKQVEIHRYILPDEILNRPTEAISVVEPEAIKRFNQIIEPKKKKGNSRSEDGMQEIIIKIIADKKARMNPTHILFKKYHITKATFYKYATQEQANELAELQKKNRSGIINTLRRG